MNVRIILLQDKGNPEENMDRKVNKNKKKPIISTKNSASYFILTQQKKYFCARE